MTRRRALALAVMVLLTASRARALDWPDVADSVQNDLSSDDSGTRLAAARRLKSLGATRGGLLALRALDDAEDDVRLAAADAAMRFRVRAATDRITTWLNAPSVQLRRMACEVAAAMPSPRAIPTLARALGDPDAGVRDAAARALGRQSGPDAVAPLLGRLDDSSPTVRISIASALARLKDSRAVIPLVGKLEDSSAEVREAAARALGELGDSRASAPLVAALRDRNLEVRRGVLVALGRLRAGDAVDAMSPFLSDRAPALRLAALQGLARVASPQAIRLLVAALGAGDEASAGLDETPVRSALVAAGTAAIPALQECMASSKVPSASAGAAWVLGALKAHALAPAIVAAMRSGSLPAVFALHALAGAGTEDETPVVLEFVADSSAVVRSEALDTAMALLDPSRPDGRAVEPLAAALSAARTSPQERVRIAAILGRTGAPRAAPILARLTRSGDPPLRLAAIDALGAIGPAEEDGALLEALASPDAPARLHAALALSDAGGAPAREALLTLMEGDDAVDRASVLTALGGIMARIPTAHAVDKLAANLRLAAGPERDATLEAIARSQTANAFRVLAEASRSQEPYDRRAAAAALAAHASNPMSLATLRALLQDAEPTVRAEAAWSLGSVGDASDVERLGLRLRDPDRNVAVDALAAIGRISARGHSGDASRLLCPALADRFPYARVNALAGLRAAGARCPTGAEERRALLSDPSEEVRAAAAFAVSTRSGPDDLRALDDCARTEPSATVAARCKAPPGAASPKTNPVVVYVVPDGWSRPRPDASYGILWADGLVRLGSADRRGAFFDPVAPEGPARLVPLAHADP